MNIRFLPTALLGFISIIILNWSCTKLDTTNLGDDLLPVVDNVNTFSTPFDVLAYQGLFADTTSLAKTDDHILGRITTDPVFGDVKASLYLQFKPGTFPFQMQASGDTLVALDSIILALSYRGAWGDTSITQPIRLTVNEIPPNTFGLWDSVYKAKYISYQPIPYGGGTSVLPTSPTPNIFIPNLDDKVYYNAGKDSTTHQIRIKLSNTYGNKLFWQDSAQSPRTALGYIDNGFFKDSIFKSKFKGLAIEADAGEALMRISLGDPNTRLEFYYRTKNGNEKDTTYSFLKINTSLMGGATSSPSAVANKVEREANMPWHPLPGPRVQKDEIYLQTTPGSFAEYYIPGLNAFRDTNRIIHRAQLRIIQIPENAALEGKFTAPAYLYLDLRDTTNAVEYKPIYLDLNPTQPYDPDDDAFFYPEGVELGYFGGFEKKMFDPVAGREISYYDFNITRYIQRMVIAGATSPNYDLRVFAPFSFSYPQRSQRIIGYGNNLAHGRVKVGGSAGSGNYRTQLTIIWSKVKVP